MNVVNFFTLKNPVPPENDDNPDVAGQDGDDD
jgi:hypothetical protein